MQDTGKRSGPDEEVHTEVLLDEDSVASNIITNTGVLIRGSLKAQLSLTLLQTVRSNEQMMQSMKGATSLLGSMNRQMNLPALQRIAMEFERENDIMDQRQEMMDDAIDDVTGLEDEEEGEEVVNQVLDEIGVDMNQALGETPSGLQKNAAEQQKVAQAIGGGGGGEDDDLEARMKNLRG